MAEYNGSDTVQRIFIYGNYIDEVVFIYNFYSYSYYFYVHDHLYSPAALVDSTGTVVERYEYDAYGNPTIWNADFTTERANSNYGNPYLFTGRRVDILDSGSLKIQYNRNRYYDYYSGRWLTHDPLGITPNVRKPNVFEILKRYEDGLNLYYALDGNPVTKMDMYGLTSCDICGPDVTMNLVAVINRIVNDFQDMNDTSEDPERDRHCDALYDTSTRGGAWEIYQLHGRGWISNQFSCCATKPRCYNTVEVSGKCYHASSVNYLMWGVMNNLCGNSWDLTFLAIYAHKLWKHHHLPTPETIDWARTGYILPTDWPSHLPVSRHRHCETDRCFDFHPGTAVPRFTYRWDALPEPGIDWIDW